MAHKRISPLNRRASWDDLKSCESVVSHIWTCHSTHMNSYICHARHITQRGSATTLLTLIHSCVTCRIMDPCVTWLIYATFYTNSFMCDMTHMCDNFPPRLQRQSLAHVRHLYSTLLAMSKVVAHTSHVTHEWISHVTQMNKSCHTYEWVISHIWMSHVTRKNESCHIKCSYVWHDAFTSLNKSHSFMCVTWNIHMCDMNHRYMRYLRIHTIAYECHIYNFTFIALQDNLVSYFTFILLTHNFVSMNVTCLRCAKYYTFILFRMNVTHSISHSHCCDTTSSHTSHSYCWHTILSV